MNQKEMRRPYRKYVQRLDEMERMIRYLTLQIGNVEDAEITKNCVQEFIDGSGSYSMDTVEAELTSVYEKFVEFTGNNATLMQEKACTQEEIQVAKRALTLLVKSGSKQGLEEDLLDRRLGAVSGVVATKDEMKLRVAIFRASRGNSLIDMQTVGQFRDPKTGEMVLKSVFVVYFQGVGGSSGSLHQKVTKVCTAMGVSMYAWPQDHADATKRCTDLSKALRDKELALEGFMSFLRAETGDLCAPPRAGSNSKIEEYRLFCLKEKSIYSVLNCCTDDMLLRVNVWYPELDHDDIENVLKTAMFNGKSPDTRAMLMPMKGKAKTAPPTYTKTNEYTQSFQDVIDTYGIPRYQESNPALIATVTFPFIFGMMYGDIGHGLMLFGFGVYLVMRGEQFRYTIPPLCEARYMVLSLGFFATYAGFLYNDFFSIGLPLFESRWEKSATGEYSPLETYDTKNAGGGGPYPFGVDWVWAGASNELLFLNSMKMKLSVCFGVLQMIVGVLLRWGNAFYDKNTIDFVFECIPMMIFMVCFFGWMDYMILYKWTHPIDNPPSIINSLICMAMGQPDLMPIYEGSVDLSKSLMLYTVISVPFMLFPKPFLLLWQHNKAEKAKAEGTYMDVEEASGGHGHGEHEEFEFGEIFIHQIIETIEYVLGTVSHTASYLRIWALSLAHQQLSLVFFQKTLDMGLELAAPVGPPVNWVDFLPLNAIVLYFMFGAWFMVTLAVLLGMDVLECFLHTLRLHWVEFQSKFYKADGYKFEPYDIKKLVTPGGDE